MQHIVAALDFLFGCHHQNLSRVFTLDGQTYRLCCDGVARLEYSLMNMSVKRRLFMNHKSIFDPHKCQTYLGCRSNLYS
jgi:hypothetical protein